MNEIAIFEQLPYRNLTREMEPYQRRVLLFDPSEVFNRIETNPFKKYQGLVIGMAFPEKKDGLCDCGCGKLITKPRRRWATNDCQYFALTVYLIITGDWGVINGLIELYYGVKKCRTCGIECETINHDNTVKVDYIIPVKEGGGGCWLNNYELICNDCRAEKEAERKAMKQLPQKRNGYGN